MSFFAIFIALILEQVCPLAHHNPVHAAMRTWAHLVQRNIHAGQRPAQWATWLIAALLPALLSGAIYQGLWQLSSVLGFIWVVLLLYVTLGFRQFSHHFSHIRQSLHLGRQDQARAELARWMDIDASELPSNDLIRPVITHALICAHRRVFGVVVFFLIFWMLGLGPAGAVLYHLAEYLARHWKVTPAGSPSALNLSHIAAAAWQFIDYLPARLTALAFAVVGNFEEAVTNWRSHTPHAVNNSDEIILAAGSGALNLQLQRTPQESGTNTRPLSPPCLAHLDSMVGLVWRAVVLWMLLLALMGLAHLTG